MINALTLDSSVFLSGLTAKETHHSVSVELLGFIIKNKIKVTIPMIVYFEIIHAYYRASKNIKETDEVDKQLIYLTLIGVLKIINMEANSLAEFIEEHNNFDIKTSDAVIAVCALKARIPLITWDNKLLKVAAHKVQSYTPKEFLNKYA